MYENQTLVRPSQTCVRPCQTFVSPSCSASLPVAKRAAPLPRPLGCRGHLAEQGTAAGVLFEGYAALVQLVVPMDIGRVILADPG